MIPKRLNVMFAFFTYTGTSSGTAVNWSVASWWAKTLLKIKTHTEFTSRISYVNEWQRADTPITMTRNLAIKTAYDAKADILVMIDSDMCPDVNLGNPYHADAVPFFDTAFDTIYNHYDKGPLVIGAPYGGPPPHENMYVFTWSQKMNADDESPFELRQYNREEAQQFMGMMECAALPTGLIMYDMRAFDLIEKPWFHYEWKDDTESEKASTEDVQNTRDISISCLAKHGYNPLRCAWSSWAGHYKVWCVNKPAKLYADNVAKKLSDAIKRGWYRNEGILDLDINPPKGSANTPVILGPKAFKDMCIASQYPDGFPEHKIVPHLKNTELVVRTLFGHKTVTFLHMTPVAHLNGLRDTLAAEAKLKGRKLDIIEVGSWVGESAVAMAEYAKSITCVDNWSGTDSDWTETLNRWVDTTDIVKELFDWNVKDFPHIRRITGESVKVANDGHDFCADVIVVDADHKYESTLADLEAWYPHLKPGGLIIGHDFNCNAFPGVTKAAVDFFGYKVEGFAMMRDIGGYFCHRKPDGEFEFDVNTRQLSMEEREELFANPEVTP